MDIQASYDSAATAYAEHLFGELVHKPLDRHLLNRFAESVRGKGLVADLGCGPGHVAKYLHDRSVAVCGVDLSPGMIRCATKLCPALEFRVGDMRALDFADGGLAGIVAFYSIVHFEPPELAAVLHEFRRVLAPTGVMLMAFHAGDETIHVDDLWGRPVSLDFRFHQPNDVRRALHSARFTVTESAERKPYAEVEYPSSRCYLFATAD